MALLRRLPLDARARCSAVCPTWRDAAELLRGGSRLHLTRSGLAHRAAAVLAHATHGGGTLAELHLAGCRGFSMRELQDFLTAHGSTLEELRVLPAIGRRPIDVTTLREWLRVAPCLRTLELDVRCRVEHDAGALLRNEPPFAPLRLRHLTLHAGVPAFAAPDTPVRLPPALEELLSDASRHSSLAGLRLYSAALDAPEAFAVIVDVALARRLTSLSLCACGLSPASYPMLARLLVDTTTLTQLEFLWSLDWAIFMESAHPQFTDALSANRTLTALNLHRIFSWTENPAACAALFRAMTAHPTIRSLALARNHSHALPAEDSRAALGALVSANAPALTYLNVCENHLGDDGLRPMLTALPGNTHLRVLKIDANGCSEAFARTDLLPAVRANTSLHVLSVGDFTHNIGMEVPSDGEEDDPDWPWPGQVEREAGRETRLFGLDTAGEALDPVDEALLIVLRRAQAAATAEALQRAWQRGD